MILSSDDTAPVSDLPPSDPPEYSDMEDEMGEVDHNRDFLTSDDIPLATTLDDIPLAADEPSSEYIPLAEVIRNRQQNFTAPLPNIIHHQRLRSSSLPTPVQATAESDDILYTPRTEKRHRDTIMTQKRLTTMSLNNTRRLEQAEEERIMKINSRNKVFKDILGTLQQRGYSLAEFLHYVFNPSTLHIFDWRWRGFFRNKETVKEILNYWVSGYNDSTNTLMETWILEQTEAIVRQESKAITDSGILASMTRQLREMAPRSFQLFDAFSTTRRQEREMKEKSRQRQELIKGSAILSLLRSKSQNNNYAQAVLGTYLMATGAQRQHFHVFSSLGTSMSYNSIISRSTSGKDPAETKGGQEPAASKEPATPSKEPAESNGGEQSATTKRKKQTPGTLYLLSQACRRTTQMVAKSHLFMTVYDNVNVTIAPGSRTHTHLFARSINPGLRGDIYDKVETLPDTLEKWYEIAKNYATRWSVRNRMKARQSGKIPIPIKQTEKRTWNFTRPAPRDPNAMDIDAMSVEERTELMRKGACFFCKEQGHRAADCPKKKGKQPTKKYEPPAKKKYNAKDAHAHIRALIEDMEEEEQNDLFGRLATTNF
ncbi:hypothetical protein BDZ97DRAFT_1916075 [Flammula alnicola]|nr:hypothetical protein BDZ97DRAFT_1916075 [Flammula alnicola]